MDIIRKKKIILTIVEAAAIFFAAFAICFFDLFSSFDTMLSDNFYQKPRAINNKIKIIGIDDQTLRELGPMGTWSRQVYADLLDVLGDNPDEVVFDLMIFGDMDKNGDDAFRKACYKSNIPIVAGSYMNFRSEYQYSDDGVIYLDNFSEDVLDLPVVSCDIGFVNAFPDEDGTVRSAMLTYEFNGEKLESLAYRAYRNYCAAEGITEKMPELEDGKFLIDYAGYHGDYEEISLCKVLSGEIDPVIFKDCIVFVGAYTTGLYDQFAVPNSADIMFGPEIHANIVQALIDGRSPVKADRKLVSLICAAAAGILCIICSLSEAKVFSPIGIILGIGYIASASILNNKGIIVPIFYFPFYVFLVIILGIVHHYIRAYLDRKRISEVFKKYVAPQVVDEITGKGSYTLKLGGESREVAVLFVDIRGFTPMSESLEPEQVVDILNSYLELTTNSIFNNGGMLDKFIGDATMAVFNAPFDLEDYIFKACKTALDIVAGGDAIESKFIEKYGRSVGFGVGVNCGRAVVGNIGCSFRMDYTAIGDTVNTAARLEANAKRGQVLISEDVYERVKDRITAEPVGAIPLKGKSNNIFVYSLTGIKEPEDRAE